MSVDASAQDYQIVGWHFYTVSGPPRSVKHGPYDPSPPSPNSAENVFAWVPPLLGPDSS